MSDTVFVEENVRHQLDSSRSEGIGVLVGRLTSKESFVLHFVPTPALEESPEDYGGNGLPSEEWWIEDHAHQVWDHLPGGISVVGLCLISPSLGESTAAALYKLTRQLQKPRELLPSSILPHFLIGLHFSTLTQSLTCKRLDPHHIEDVEVITCGLPNLWCCIESTVPIQLETLVPMSSVDSSPAVHQLITDFDMWQSDVYVLGGQYCHGEEPLVNYVQEGRAMCTLYPKSKAFKCGQSQLVDNGRVMTLCGSIAALAYIPQKCTVAEAFKAVSGDLVQAMTVSWRKMCEDDYCHQKKQLKGIWCLPQRIQLSVKECRFPLCAYRFPDETDEDMYERVCEVFSIDVTNICCKPHLDGECSPKKACTGSEARSLSLWLVIAAGIIALIAIIFFV